MCSDPLRKDRQRLLITLNNLTGKEEIKVREAGSETGRRRRFSLPDVEGFAIVQEHDGEAFGRTEKKSSGGRGMGWNSIIRTRQESGMSPRGV